MNSAKFDWNDELIVLWLQKYSEIKQPLVEILIRRYKNLLYKEMARQCDQRYDKEDIVQQIIFLFVQLLDEYDPVRGIPLAGFLKAKLPNRTYNYFKSQVKQWTAEVLQEIMQNPGEIDDTHICEIGATELETYEFWKQIAKIVDWASFSLLYFKFECDYSNEDISFLINKNGAHEVERTLFTILEKLRYDPRLVNQYFGLPMKDVVANAPTKKTQSSSEYNMFQVLCHEVAKSCGVTSYGKTALLHFSLMRDIYQRGQEENLRQMIELVDYTIKLCKLSNSAGVRKLC